MAKAIFFKLTLILFIAVICLFLFLRSSFFDLRRVIVTGNQVVPAESVLELAQVDMGINIFMMDFKSVALAAQEHPLIKKVEPYRRLPDTLELHITERVSWALVSVPEGMVVVDQEGVYLDKIDYITNPNLPLITLSELPYMILGQPTNQIAVESVYKLYSALDKETIASISEYHYNNSTDEVTLYTIQGTEIRFGSTGERLTQKIPLVRQALTMEKELSSEGKETLTYMDIRYEGFPVIQTN